MLSVMVTLLVVGSNEIPYPPSFITLLEMITLSLNETTCMTISTGVSITVNLAIMNYSTLFFYDRGCSLSLDDSYVPVFSNYNLHNIFNDPAYTGTELKKEATVLWLKLLHSEEWFTTTKK